MNSPIVATFSIVAQDPQNGDLGVAVASKFLAVGAVVPWAQASAGAIATQALANIGFGPRGMALMAAGRTAAEALEALLANDPERDHRQVGLVDAREGLFDELLDGAEAHGEREHDDGRAREPDRLERGHERARGRPDQPDVVARRDPTGLEGGRHRARVGVELAPGNPLGSIGGIGGAADEGHGARSARAGLEARAQRRHVEVRLHGSRRGYSVRLAPHSSQNVIPSTGARSAGLKSVPFV